PLQKLQSNFNWERFTKNSLKDFTPEEDFILGVLLGYNVEQQCKRYIERKVS
ncbi:DUF2023 family protein, partial [Fusobacterium hominis]|uniref:DUF2023 family protein n=1 Tax=Fusobacterium hominis TaxID=2764326 RepID=UPI0022E61ADA